MKKMVALLVSALMVLSFSMIAVAADEKTADKPVVEKTDQKDSKKADKKDTKKDKKDVKKDDKKKTGEAKPAAKGKKEVSGC